jgi:hypothetical protein
MIEARQTMVTAERCFEGIKEIRCQCYKTFRKFDLRSQLFKSISNAKHESWLKIIYNDIKQESSQLYQIYHTFLLYLPRLTTKFLM